MARTQTTLTVEPVPEPVVTVTARLVTSPKVEATVAAYLEVSAKLAQLEGKKEKLKAELKALHEKYGPAFETADFAVTQSTGTHTSIQREVLVKLGVKASVIEQATAKTSYTYSRARRKA